ncbi:hypothetical protein FBUS_10984 [Fasciolopsis buskii]|uniref:Uncharacterized protein n=1 Tax=Fasciolopsis buskii TaxID=27845 RepID=A0A8E0S144_9TREM|nr:hypothetical protein FBUS_10984 [Fasciolopsis buski]
MLSIDAVDVTRTTTTAKMPPPNVGSHNLLKLKSPGRSADNTESSGDLNSLSGYDSGDLDRYLQIPPAFLDSEGVERWAGRRDSCTMTAEVLSALNATNADSPVTLDRSKGDSTVTGISVANKFSGHLDMRSTSDGLNNYYDHAPTAPLFDSSQMQPSDFQNMASKLGISMTPNDYQLLTNPQLANYVTDETTETQLLG